jgi:hypothetical protein
MKTLKLISSRRKGSLSASTVAMDDEIPRLFSPYAILIDSLKHVILYSTLPEDELLCVENLH